ncbi:MAG: hypothetical protein LR005_01435 [Candidatus Pacebacteria bacterium]|nr:hypothetical protein [Candidatus Paceibacterota bacterium]
MKKIFISIIKKPKNIIFLVTITALIFILLRLLPTYEILKNFYALPNITFSRKLEVFYQYIFEPFFRGTFQEKFSTIILSILTSLNILLFIIFAKRQGKILSGKGFFASLSGMFLGLFGVGCISCGAFVLAPVITFLGLGTYTGKFIEHAGLISNIGIALVIISILYLLKQISKPLICK